MSTVNATMNDTTVVLECEMRAYIRPDSFLVWEGPGGRTITGGTGKHQITFSNGSPNAAANGSSLLVPSRVSTLTISAPEPSDAGTYTCRVTGVENPVVAIDLLVDGLRGIETTDTISTMAADVDTTRLDAQAPTSTTANNQVFQVIGAVLGSVAVVILILAGLLAVVVCRVFRTQRKSRTEVHIVSSNKGAGVQQPVYDYIDLPELKLDDTIDRRYSGVPHQAKRNDRDYYEIKDDPNADIYDEIRDNRERDDDTYDTIKIVNTTETNRNDLEKSGVYDVPIGGHGTLVAGNDVFGVTRDEVDIAHNVERNKIDGGAISQNDYDYADIDTMVDSDVIGVTNGSMQ